MSCFSANAATSSRQVANILSCNIYKVFVSISSNTVICHTNECAKEMQHL